MSLILCENLFPNVISIWHPLYKEKHMLAIHSAVWMQLLGSQPSYAILRNLHFHYLFEKMQKCWALRWPSELKKGFWTLFDLVCSVSWAEGHPAVQELPWHREMAYGPGVERQCLAWGPCTDPLSKWLITFYFSRLQFAIHFPLSFIFMLKKKPCYAKEESLGLGNRRPGFSLNQEVDRAIW